MSSFQDYYTTGSKWLTVLETEFYPDSLDVARPLYESVLKRFEELVNDSCTSPDLLRAISREPAKIRIQLQRIFRKYVSTGTPVEMLKRKSKLEEIIRDFGAPFRPIEIVRQKIASRPRPDDAIIALLYEYRDRGQKGYELTGLFFAWFAEKFGEDYTIIGPEGAGRDVMLDEVLTDYQYKTPADFLISKPDGTPLAVGFARYDSDRGGAQEDDRTGGNRDKVTEIRAYAQLHGVPLKVIFLNDGPGLLLGSMWRDYAALEAYGQGDVLVSTLKILDDRLTREWLES